MGNIVFVNPYLFWILALPLVVFALLVSTNKDRLSRLFDDKVLARLSVEGNTIPESMRTIIMMFAILLMLIALARPAIERGEKTVDVKGLTLLAALDISGSMRSKDNYPSRLEFAKNKMLTLFEAMPSDEIGAVAFAHASFVLAPFSSDKVTLSQIIERVDDRYINMASTDFSALGDLAANMLEKKKPKILVVFSDGGDEKALKGFADIVKKEGIELYAVLVGTKEGAPVLDSNGKPLTKNDGTIAISQRNDALGEIARESGGTYIIADTGKEGIKKLVDTIRSKHKTQKQAEVKIKDRVELFIYPLGVALLMLLVALSSLPMLRGGKK